MDLLDFDNEKILAQRRMPAKGAYSLSNKEYEPDPNFSELQNLGHAENSKDFEDSPFANRKPLKEEEQI